MVVRALGRHFTKNKKVRKTTKRLFDFLTHTSSLSKDSTRLTAAAPPPIITRAAARANYSAQSLRSEQKQSGRRTPRVK
jgi:hypothetical protein